MTQRANAALRLLHLARQIEDLAQRLRAGWTAEDSHTLWTICAAHQRLSARLHEEAERFTRALPRSTAPLENWRAEYSLRGEEEAA